MLFFGWITVKLVAVPDEAERAKKRRRRRRRAPKNRLEWMLQRLRHHVCRRLLLIMLSGLFVLGYFYVKLWMKNFIVNVGAVKINVWQVATDYLTDIFN